MSIFNFFTGKSSKSGVTFVKPQNDDGAIDVDVSEYQYAAQIQHAFDLDRIPTNEYELIHIYRTMSLNQEIDEAIQEIVNEAIITDEMKSSVSIVLSSVELSENIKDKISEEFDEIVRLLNFKNRGYNLFNRWYIDGKLVFHKVVDTKSKNKGLVDIVPIDPLNIKLIREMPVKRDKDANGLQLYDLSKINEYFLYSKAPIMGKEKGSQESSESTAVRIPRDAITYCTSGVTDETGRNVLSYLYKAIKPWNNLKLMEDSLVIYRVTRAPERRAFYIDVGNLPKGKAEQYLRDTMNRFKNKIVYDASTGTISNQKKYHAMIEDFWLPRREGGRGTEIDTLPGGQQLGEIDDVTYFKDKLYKSLNVPLSRFQQDSASFNIGRTTEITRDEVKFSKFISRLRKRFSYIFDDLLKTQLVLKKIITEDEWDEIVDDISYSFLEDNLFSEFKEMELLNERIELVGNLQNNEMIGRYYSKAWVQRNVLKMSDKEIEEMEKEIKEEEPEEEDSAFAAGHHAQFGPEEEPEVPEPPQPEPEVPEQQPQPKQDNEKDEDEEQ